MATTKRRATDQAIRAYIGEIESWKVLHDEGTACLDFEELLAFGNSIFDAISQWDAIWHQKVHSKEAPYDASDERSIFFLYKLWSAPSAYVLSEIDRFEKKDDAVRGAETFRTHCKEVRDLLISDEEFFGEELVALQDEALAANQRGETVEFEELGD